MPALPTEIPARIELCDRQDIDFTIAEGLVHAGWLSSKTLAISESVEEAIQRALVSGLTDGFEPALHNLILTIDNDIQPDAYGFAYPEPGDHLNLILSLGEVHCPPIGRKLMRMCRGDIRPARAVLLCLELAGNKGVPLFTPEIARYQLEMLHWHGCQSQREAHAEVMSMGEHPAEFELISDQEAFGYMPRWTTDTAPLLRGSGWNPFRDSLERAVDVILGPWIKRLPTNLTELCTDLLEAASRLKWPLWMDPDTGRALIDFEDCDQCFCTIVRWSPDDAMLRLFDDWAEYTQQHGSVGTVTRRTIPATDPGRAATVLNDFKTAFDILRTTDQLLQLLVEDDQ